MFGMEKHSPTRRMSMTSSSRRSFLISQLDNSDTSIGHFRCNIKNAFCFLKQKTVEFTPEELEEKITKLHKFCLSHIPDSYRVHLYRVKGIELLEEIVDHVNKDDLKHNHVIRMVWSAISCVHHYYLRVKGFKGTVEWVRKRQAKKSLRIFEKMVILLLPDRYTIVIQAMITFYTEAHIWDTEHLCTELLKILLYSTSNAENVIHAILDIVDKTSLSDIKESRQVLRVLYEVLENIPWRKIDEILLMRILNMFYSSILPDEDEEYNYQPLRKGLEVCVRNILRNLLNADLRKVIKQMLNWAFFENIPDEALLDFGNVLEYAAMLHNTQLYSDCLPHDVFPLILRMIASENLLHSLLGNRVFQHLFDRNNNRLQFDTPRVFYQDTHFNVVVGEYQSRDKMFVTRYREMIHATLLASVEQHGIYRINLESIYTSIALMVVEIPCGFTAAAVICLAMAIQESTLADDTIDLESAHRLHATVLSIISLVCWVHNAQVFYDYLNQILTRRAQFAPHLNPPLRSVYQYAQHHILWNKPELFFEDWEARYGLWKCFRSRKIRLGQK